MTKTLKGMSARPLNTSNSDEFISARNVFVTQPIDHPSESGRFGGASGEAGANLGSRLHTVTQPGHFLTQPIAPSGDLGVVQPIAAASAAHLSARGAWSDVARGSLLPSDAGLEFLVKEAPEFCMCGVCAYSNGKPLLDGGGDAGTDRNVTHVIPPVLADEPTQVVTVGGFVTGVIDVTGDEDLVTADLVAGQTYMVTLRGTGGTPVTDTFLTIVGPGSIPVNTDDDGGTGTFSTITFTATLTGTYTFTAESFSNPGDPGLGEWTLNLFQRGVDDVPGTIASTVTHTIGSTTFNFIETSGDQDVYEVNLTAGFIYSFEVAAGADYNTDWQAVPTGEVDTIIDILDSAGNVIASVDDIAFPDDISSAVSLLAETSGTYYVRIRGYSGQTGGYTLISEEQSLGSLDPLDAINWFSADNIDTVDVLGVPTAYVYFGAVGENFGETGDDGVTPAPSLGWSAYEQQQLMLALEQFEHILGINYEVTTTLAQATFRVFTTTSNQFGAYFYPQDPAFGAAQGIGAFNTLSGGWTEAPSLQQGGYSFAVILHEFGHAHGLAHPHDNGGGSDVLLGVTASTGSYGIFDLNQGVYTVMSYNDAWDMHPDGPSPYSAATRGFGWSGTLSAFDIAVLQDRYGVHAYNGTDTVYTLDTANAAGTFYECIWDSGGTDVIQYAGSADATIDLLAATLDYTATGGGVLSFVDGIWGGFTIANGAVIENATGGTGNDNLLGNSVANVLTGNGGNDIFLGRAGNDTLHGGLGIDTAMFSGNAADYTITAIVGGWTIVDNNLADGDDGTDTFYDGELAQFDDAVITLDATPGNQAPTLTGLAATVSYNENVVNAGPQLLDGDVDFQDPDGNFDGGTLVVSGLLAEDTVGIRNEGTGAGQIGVSGANITYSGLVIGTFTGGAGTTLTVTLNANATAVAVDQLIENLTYANAAGDPTLNRTLTLNVTDADGASLGGSVYTPGPYVERTAAANPLNGITAGAGPVLATIDADNDGDLDLILGDQPGVLRYFQNNGGAFTELLGASNPFGAFNSGGGSYTSPEAIDFDGDGDMDLAYGENDGTIHAVRNNGNGTFTELVGAGVNPFNGFDVGGFSDAAAGDWDGDGDMDLASGAGAGITANNGTILYFQNNGGVFTAQVGATNPFNGAAFDVGNYSSPTGGDVDGDGDIDLVVANSAGVVRTFLNNGSGVFAEAVGAANPFNGIALAGGFALAALIDLDGDGDVDLTARGNTLGPIRYFENTGSFAAGTPPTIAVEVLAQNDAPSGTNNSHTIPEGGSYQYTTADFGFSDTDGDSLLAVVVTTLPTNGQLQLNGVNVTLGQVVTAADITAGLLDFVPDAGESGTGYATWTFQVRDDGGTANSGVNTDPSANNMVVNVTPANTAPTLTGFGPSVTFLENTVNATPQILDADVTFNDAEGNFTGGTVVVSGVLAEDIVGIRNEGTGAGQIGVSGANVTYGGVVIGTYAGGTGASLTVTLNAAATSAAVDALIQNLTYANTSDTPTASRTLTINVTDAGGLDLTLPGGYVEATGANDPLAGLPTFGPGPNLAFVDVNNDGDLDIVVGDQDGSLRYFENNGAGYTEVTGASNPFDGFVGETQGGATGSLYTAPATIDVDGDGDLDLAVANNYGYFGTMQNNGNGTWTQLTGAANPFDGIVDVYFADPTGIDYDGDGDMDLVSGSSYGDLYAIRNDGGGNFTFVSGVGRPFGGAAFDVGSFSSAASGDVDGDGDLDLVVGESDGSLNTFINNGGGNFTAAVGAANPFNGVTFDTGSYSIPTLVDIDGDGDDDLVVGDNSGGDTRVWLNNAGGTPTIVVNVTAESDIYPVELYDTTDTLVATYQTIQAAVDAASNGYRIFIGAGTYTENVTVDVDVTIQGANVGIAGDGARATESIIDGQVTISADGVTIDGVSIIGDAAGPLGTTGVIVGVGSDNFSIVNSILDGDGDFAFFVNPVTGLNVATNLIQGYSIGFYITGGATAGSIHDNLFQGDGGPLTGLGNGVNSESSHVLIQNNTFDGIYSGVLNLFPMGPNPVDLDSYVIGNTLTGNAAPRPVQVYPTATSTNITGTDYNEAFNGDIAGLATGTQLTFDGQGGDDHIYGFDAADTLTGGSGDDRIYGQAGNDILSGGLGQDILYGEGGIDSASFAGSLTYTDTVLGWVVSSGIDGNDILDGVEVAIDGGGQRNLLVGATAYTTLQLALTGAQTGDNVRLATATYTGVVNYAANGLTVYAQPGATQNLTYATASPYGITIYAAGNADTITTGTGADFVYGGGGADNLNGGGGSDYVDGQAGADTMNGGGGDDFIFVDAAGDVVAEGAAAGYDNVLASVDYTLTAGAEVEVLSTNNHAGTGFFVLTGNELSNVVIGNAGANILDGGLGGTDRMAGFGGNDFLIVDSGDIVDEANGGGYDNVLARSDYELTVGMEVEVLSTTNHAGTDAIDLTGNEFANVVIGNAGANILDGSFGHDRLAGFGGADSYRFSTNLSSFNWDTIDGYDSDDVMLLDDAVFTGMSLGALAPGAFVIGSAAADADDRIIYNSATGELFFDADGNGSGAQVQFALLLGAPPLDSTDFTVI